MTSSKLMLNSVINYGARSSCLPIYLCTCKSIVFFKRTMKGFIKHRFCLCVLKVVICDAVVIDWFGGTQQTFVIKWRHLLNRNFDNIVNNLNRQNTAVWQRNTNRERCLQLFNLRCVHDDDLYWAICESTI